MKTAIVAIGMPGSGKTTLLKPLAARYGYVYINRDEIRQELLGDQLTQEHKALVWAEGDRRIEKAFKVGKHVAYDATFAEQKKRRDFIASLRDKGAECIVGFYADIDPEIAKERNRNRKRVVPEEVFEEHYVIPLREFPPSLEDGFDQFYTLAQIDALEDFMKASLPQ